MRNLRVGTFLAALSLGLPVLGSDEVRLVNGKAALYRLPVAKAVTEGTGVRNLGKERSAPPRDLLAVPTPALSFTGIAPCRVADTRDAGFPAGYGPPFMPAGVPRDFTITGRCGIPSAAQAVSLNFTVVNPVGPGFLLVFPQGGIQPTVSTLNYMAGQIVANAAVLSLGATGAITAIPGVSGFDLVIDVNGYYAPPQEAFSHLIAVGAVLPNGNVHPSFTNLGTWTVSRSGTGSYEITFAGLRPGCTPGRLPTVQVTAMQSGFVFSPFVTIECASGDTTISVFTRSTGDIAADALFTFSVYGPSPTVNPISQAIAGRSPSTCTFTASTGVTTCE